MLYDSPYVYSYFFWMNTMICARIDVFILSNYKRVHRNFVLKIFWKKKHHSSIWITILLERRNWIEVMYWFTMLVSSLWIFMSKPHPWCSVICNRELYVMYLISIVFCMFIALCLSLNQLEFWSHYLLYLIQITLFDNRYINPCVLTGITLVFQHNT